MCYKAKVIYFVISLSFISNVLSQTEDSVKVIDIGIEEDIDEDIDEFSGDGNDSDIGFEESCKAKDFINQLNISDYFPDDYEKYKNEKIRKIVPNIGITFNKFGRLVKWSNKLLNNNDLNEALRSIISRTYDTVFDIDLDPECLSSLLRILQAIQDRKIWALKFIDSFGKIPSGILEGVFSSFGDFDECLDIKSPFEDGSTISGQYCLLKPVVPYPKAESYDRKDERFELSDSFKYVRDILKQNNVDKYYELNPILKFIEQMNVMNGTFIRIGICLPNKCRPRDVQRVINNYLHPILGLPMEINESDCYVKNQKVVFDSYQIVSLYVFTTLALLVLLSTSCELYLSYIESDLLINKQTTFRRALISFSIIRNTKKLFQTDNRFASIDTIRLILAFGLGGLQIYNYTPLALALKRYSSSVPKHMLYYNRYFFARTPGLWIEPFMLTVGLVLCFTIIDKLEKSKGRFNYLTYLLKRWFRISVPFLGSVLFIYLIPLFGSGPIWHDCHQWLQPSCRDKWSLLSSFLYYSNWNAARHNYPLTSSFEICNLPTWFLSASFQFYIIAPIIFLTLYKWPNIGLQINFALIFIGILTNVSPKILLNDLTYFEPTRISSNRLQHKYFNNYHVNSFQYVCSFFMGMFTGYIMKKHPKLYIGGPIVEHSFTFIALAIIPLIYIWNNTFWILNDSPPEISVLLFFSFGKFFWCLSFAWICFACSTGRAELLNSLLSLKLIQPVSRLYYLIYLLRLPVIFYRIFTVKQTYVMTDFQTIQDLIADFVITVMLSYILYILMERPSINILKLYHNSHNDSEQVEKTNNEKCVNSNNRSGKYYISDDKELNISSKYISVTKF